MPDPRTATVSVIVPNYNHTRFLRKRIQSILSQTYQDFELILLDDCSTDDSRELLREYASDPHVTHVQFNDANSGSTFRQWKKGLALARGKYIWIAESDDYAEPTFLVRLVQLLERDGSIVFAYCRSKCVDEYNNVIRYADDRLWHIDAESWKQDFRVKGHEYCQRYFVYANAIGNASSVVFRKAAYESVGGVDDSTCTSGDWQLWAMMALKGNVAYVSEPLNYYRTHPGTVRNAVWGTGTLVPLYLRERFQVVRLVLDRVGDGPALRERAYREHARQWIPFVLAAARSGRSRRALFKVVKEFDPHPMKRLIQAAPPALLASWTSSRVASVVRNHIWFPLLTATRAIRHPLGLRRGGISVRLKKVP